MAKLILFLPFVSIVILFQGNGLAAQNLPLRVSRVTNINNYISDRDYLDRKYVRFVSECAETCSKHQSCRSFFYNKQEKYCQLHEHLYPNYYSLNYYYLSRYYKMDQVVSNFTCPLAPPDAMYNQVLLSDNTVFTYRIVWTLANKTVAEAFCAADGAVLVRVLTDVKMQALVTIFTSCTGFINVGDYWIDGSNANAVDFFNITQWKTSLNNPLPTQFWAPLEPSAPHITHCVAMWAAANYQWIGLDCPSQNYFICEK